MKLTLHLKLAASLATLVVSTVLVADVIGLLPRPEEQIRETRRLLGESLAVQLSSAVARGSDRVVVETLEQMVARNPPVQHAGLYRQDGTTVSSFGTPVKVTNIFDASSLDNLIVPIFERSNRWGEVRLSFAPSDDWGTRYLGFPSRTLQYILFLGVACLLTFYLFMRRALLELNPTKVVPERVNAAFDVLSEGVVIVDERERIVLANRSFADRLGVEPSHLVGKRPSDYPWDLKGDDVEVLPWQTSLRYGESVKGMPLRMITEADEIAFTVNSAPIEGSHGENKGCLITFDDVSPLEAKNTELAEMLAELSATQEIIQEKNKELEVLATRDPLTGSLNRRSFMDLFGEHFERALRDGHALSVMMVDIDHFKRVNDQHGHGVGDQAIKLVAYALDTQMQGAHVVCRYGGEEFAVLLPGVDKRASLDIAETARLLVSKAAADGSLPVKELTVSAGVASLEDRVDSKDQLLEFADRALYQAKETGRDRVCGYDPAYRGERRRRHQDADSDGAHTAAVEKLKSRLSRMQSLVHEQAQEITHRSMHDALTGLPNRYLLLDRLSQAMKLSARNDNLTAVVSLSLSAYQSVYDNRGMDAAESMLKEASDRLETVIRDVDTIGVAFNEQALTFSRIAQNELAVLVVDLDSVESIPKIINRITHALERPFQVGELDVLNKIYAGIAVFPYDGDEAGALIRNSSLARSHAEKRTQVGSGSAFFSSKLDTLAAKNARIAAELRHAIHDDGLHLLYQPKVDVVSGQVTGFEALARWAHEELGNIGPMEFITVAEQIGVIDQLTNWVLSRVCRDLLLNDMPSVRVSVNVSPIELCDPTTADRILEIISSCGASPQQFEVEITESSMLQNFELARSILGKLRAAGVTVALDDFGTAYSSLNLLLEMPVDVIKIDRSFVMDIHQAPGNQAVVQAIIHMARAMGKQVVAEGVENDQEKDCLADMGCSVVQGYLYSRPLAVAEARDFALRRVKRRQLAS